MHVHIRLGCLHGVHRGFMAAPFLLESGCCRGLSLVELTPICYSNTQLFTRDAPYVPGTMSQQRSTASKPQALGLSRPL